LARLPIGYRSSAPPLAFAAQLPAGMLRSDGRATPGLGKRKDFHETFANLIKLGSVDRQDAKLSQEEHTWQTELKDLIWLELQAWQADRTVEQQDKYLFEARQGVSELLTHIINYKFQPRYRREPSLISLDSGIHSDSNSNASCKFETYINLATLTLICPIPSSTAAQQDVPRLHVLVLQGLHGSSGVGPARS